MIFTKQPNIQLKFLLHHKIKPPLSNELNLFVKQERNKCIRLVKILLVHGGVSPHGWVDVDAYVLSFTHFSF